MGEEGKAAAMDKTNKLFVLKLKKKQKAQTFCLI